MDLFKGKYSFNKIRQFSFLVEYVYIAYLCILVIKMYQPVPSELGYYSPLVLDIAIALIYSIVLYYSGKGIRPSYFELILRFLYLYVAARLLAQTNDSTLQIIIVLPTVIMALRYSMIYTIITAAVTTIVLMVNAFLLGTFEIDSIFVLVSFIWILGLLVNSSMEVERKMQDERRKIQEREKLAAVGQMAAGIAHEVRNPLTTIKGYVYLLHNKEYSGSENSKDKYFAEINKEIDHMNDLLNGFLQYARPAEPRLTLNNINEIIRDCSMILEAQCISNYARVELNLDDSIPETLCDHDQIKQVLVNIVLNSVDAVQQCPIKRVCIYTKKDQENICFCVEDTGSGMTDDQKEKIFDPFYTTKKNGTGLGLSVCSMIISNHSGKIIVSSSVGQGTIFEIYLPIKNI